MVKGFVSFLNKEISAINQAAILLAGFTLLAQVLGLVRDRLLTSFVGAGAELDIYYASFQIPDLLFTLIASLVSVAVLLPFLTSIRATDGQKQANKFFNQVFTAFLGLMVVFAIVLFIVMPHLAPFVAPGFSPEELKTLVLSSRILLLSPLLLGISNLLGSVTQMFRRFYVFALSPVLYNFGIIIGVLFLYPFMGISGLVTGVLIGAFLHMAIQIPVLPKINFIPKLTRVIDWKKIREITLVSLPRTLGLMSHTLVMIVLVAVASTIDEGAISIFRLSYNLQAVPLGLIGISYSVAAFPTLSKLFASGKLQEFRENVVGALRQIIFWSLPIAFLFIVLRAQIVRVILGSASFDWSDTRLAAATLALFVVSVAAQSIVLLLTRAYYATGDTATPVRINVLSSILIIISSYGFLYLVQTFPEVKSFLEYLLRIEDIPGVPIIALAMGYSFGSLVNAFVLYGVFYRGHLRGFGRKVWQTAFDAFVGALAMAVVSYISLEILNDVFSLNTFWGVFGQGFISGVVGIVFGVGALYLLGNPEIREIKAAISRRGFRRVKVVADSPEELL